MKLVIKVWDKCKYAKDSEKKAEITVDNVEKVEVVKMEDEEIYAKGFDMVDENQEYCILTYENGETATFRNSHVDVFKW